MGIVIINGKRYNSITGLMISETENSALPKLTEESRNLPGWIQSFVDNSNEKKAAEENAVQNKKLSTASADSPSFAAPNRLRAHNQTIAVQEPMVVAAKYYQSTANHLHTAAREHARTHIRHIANDSRTLNRRFVKKPMVGGGYADSIAVRNIKKATQNIQSKAEDIQVRRANVTISTINKPHTNKTTSDKPFAKLSTKPKSNEYKMAEKIINDRLDRLTEILAETYKVDLEQENNHTKRMSRSNRKKKSKMEARKIRRDQKKAAKQSRRQKRGFRLPAIFATAGAFASMAGIAFYMLMPTISIKMAAGKAGIDAKNPYTPAGYSIDGEIAHNQGSITIKYKNKNGDDNYSITQAKRQHTNNDPSKESIDSIGHYREIDAAGTTIYVYNDHATWNRGDMQYTIDGNSALDSKQMNDIIRSL